jgi:hypothetical protein
MKKIQLFGTDFRPKTLFVIPHLTIIGTWEEGRGGAKLFSISIFLQMPPWIIQF